MSQKGHRVWGEGSLSRFAGHGHMYAVAGHQAVKRIMMSGEHRVTCELKSRNTVGGTWSLLWVHVWCG